MEADQEQKDDDFKESLRKYCDNITEIVNDSNERFEKQLSYISAGTLALSFALLEKVLKDISVTHWKGLLILGWMLCAITLIVNLFSHKLAIDYHNKTLEEVQNHLSDSNKYPYNEEIIRARNGKLSKINFWTLISLFSGIILILTYTSINITMATSKDEKGPIKPQPPKIEKPKLPNLNEGQRSDKTYSDNKVPNIIDKGHSGLPPTKPKK